MWIEIATAIVSIALVGLIGIIVSASAIILTTEMKWYWIIGFLVLFNLITLLVARCMIEVWPY